MVFSLVVLLHKYYAIHKKYMYVLQDFKPQSVAYVIAANFVPSYGKRRYAIQW